MKIFNFISLGLIYMMQSCSIINMEPKGNQLDNVELQLKVDKMLSVNHLSDYHDNDLILKNKVRQVKHFKYQKQHKDQVQTSNFEITDYIELIDTLSSKQIMSIYNYNAFGYLDSYILPELDSIYFTYNNEGKVTSEKQSDESKSVYYQYKDGLLSEKTMGDNVITYLYNQQKLTQYIVQNKNNLDTIHIVYKKDNTIQTENFVYWYDNEFSLIKKTEYDVLDREYQSTSFSYDAKGRVKSKTWVPHSYKNSFRGVSPSPSLTEMNYLSDRKIEKRIYQLDDELKKVSLESIEYQFFLENGLPMGAVFLVIENGQKVINRIENYTYSYNQKIN